MEIAKAQKKKHFFPLLGVIAVLFLIGIGTAAGGFAYAAKLESDDNFCAACHTEPEVTYVARSTAEIRVDLASFHQEEKTRCIDCHSGPGIGGRIQAELGGARNAFMFLTRTAEQPAKLLGKYPDAICLKCHQDETVLAGEAEEGEKGHWHTYLTRWQARDANAASCATCHVSHSPESTRKDHYLIIPQVRRECEACHRVLDD